MPTRVTPRARRRKKRPPVARSRWRLVGRVVGWALVVGLMIVVGIVVGTVLGGVKGGAERGEPVLIEAGEEPADHGVLVPVPRDEVIEPPPPAPMVVAALAPPTPPPPLGTKPQWLRNAVPFALPASGPMIALVFDDLGLDRRRTERVIALPAPLTLSFLPYAGDLPQQTRAGHAAGHELLVHLPMEPMAAHLDAGPGTLLTGLPADEIMRRLDHGLAAFDGYVGLNNHMGSRFTSDRERMLPVLSELRRRGLLFLDSVTIGTTVGPALATALHLPHTRRDVFLDDDLAPAAVHASLGRVERVARQAGVAVAIGHPHDVTLAAVAAWLPGLAAKGFVLAPLSAVVRANGTGEPSLQPASDTVNRNGDIHG